MKRRDIEREGEKGRGRKEGGEGGTMGSFFVSPDWLPNMSLPTILLKKCVSTHNTQAVSLLWVFNGNSDFYMV